MRQAVHMRKPAKARRCASGVKQAQVPRCCCVAAEKQAALCSAVHLRDRPPAAQDPSGAAAAWRKQPWLQQAHWRAGRVAHWVRLPKNMVMFRLIFFLPMPSKVSPGIPGAGSMTLGGLVALVKFQVGRSHFGASSVTVP